MTDWTVQPVSRRQGCPLLAALPAFICLESIHLELCPKLTRAPAATDRAALLFTGIADLTPLAAVVDLELNSDLELTGIENLCAAILFGLLLHVVSLPCDHPCCPPRDVLCL